MFSNRSMLSQDTSRDKISELVKPNQKQTYLEKQLQIENLEREREATLRLLSEVQSQNFSRSPKPANDKTILLEEARRRAKERSLLRHNEADFIKKFSYEKEAGFVKPEYMEFRKNEKFEEKHEIQENAAEVKHFIDKEYLQLKQELENLRKGSKMSQVLSKNTERSSFLEKNDEKPIFLEKNKEKFVISRKNDEKPVYFSKKDPVFELKYKERPTRDIENSPTSLKLIKTELYTEKLSETLTKREISKKQFNTESSCIEILPENSRKSPTPQRKQTPDMKTSKKDLPEPSFLTISSSLSIAASETTKKKVENSLNHENFAQNNAGNPSRGT